MITYPHTCEFTLGGGSNPRVTIIMVINADGSVTCTISQDDNHPITGSFMGFFLELPGTSDYIDSGLVEDTNGTNNVNMNGALPSNGGTWDGFYLIDENQLADPNYTGPVEVSFQLTGNWQSIDWETVQAGIRMQAVNNAAGSVKLTAFCDETIESPAIQIIKQISVDGGKSWLDADEATGPEIFSCVDPLFKFVVTNTGNVALSNVQVKDTDFGDITTYASLGVGETQEFIFGDDLSEDEIVDWQSGQHTNTATVTAVYEDQQVSDEDDANYFGVYIDIEVEKFVSVDGGQTWVDANEVTGPYLLSGTEPQFKFVVTNNSNINLTNIVLADSDFDLNGAAEGKSVLLNLTKGGSDAVYFTGTWAAGQHTNTATVTADYTDDAGNTKTDSDSDDANYYGADPSIDVEKYVSIDSGTTWCDADSPTGKLLLNGFDAPKFKFVITNTGNVDLTNVDLTDDVFGDISLNGTLAVGKSAEYVIDGTWAEGQHTNTATVTGDFTDSNGTTQTETDKDEANYFGATPAIDVEKFIKVAGEWDDADAALGADGPTFLVGSNVEYKFVVKNTGNVELSAAMLSDTILGVFTGELDFTGTNLEDGILAVGEEATVYATGYWADGYWSAGQHSNLATASGSFTDDAGNTATPDDTDPAYYFFADPSIHIEKTTRLDGDTGPGGDGLAFLKGSNIEWVYVVTNTGNVALSGLSLFDDEVGEVTSLSYTVGDTDEFLEDGEVWTYVFKGVADMDAYDNTGTITASYTDSNGNSKEVTDSDDSSYTTYWEQCFEGYTQGFWKTHAGAGKREVDVWKDGYAPTDKYESVFGVDAAGIDLIDGGKTPTTLLQVLNTSISTNQELILARQAIAALLNAADDANDDSILSTHDYAFTVDEIIDAVQHVYGINDDDLDNDGIFQTDLGLKLAAILDDFNNMNGGVCVEVTAQTEHYYNAPLIELLNA